MKILRPAMLLRRLHLYLGLGLFPWAVLYGVTAFLFNHPTAFPDADVRDFGRGDLAGTPLETPPAPRDIAAAVVAELNKRGSAGATYTLQDDPAPDFGRDSAFATAKAADGANINILFDARGAGGTLRVTPLKPEEKIEKAPFATGSGDGPGRRGGGGRNETPRPARDPITLPDPVPEKVLAAAHAILAKHGFADATDVKVTSVPPITFRVADAAGRSWSGSYDATGGGVTGKPADGEAKEPPSVRRFLLRMHVAHGYPGGGGVRWYWALIVDAMAFTMVFWGVSGLVMWWQLKSQRKLGFAILFVSAAAAAALGWGMHAAMTAAG